MAHRIVSKVVSLIGISLERIQVKTARQFRLDLVQQFRPLR